MKKNINAPAVLALVAVALLIGAAVIILLSEALRGTDMHRHGVRDGLRSVQIIDTEQLRDDLTQGRI